MQDFKVISMNCESNIGPKACKFMICKYLQHSLLYCHILTLFSQNNDVNFVPGTFGPQIRCNAHKILRLDHLYNERSSADSCISQRVNGKMEIKEFSEQFIICDQLVHSSQRGEADKSHTELQTISRSYSRQAVNSLCETINIYTPWGPKVLQNH